MYLRIFTKILNNSFTFKYVILQYRTYYNMFFYVVLLKRIQGLHKMTDAQKKLIKRKHKLIEMPICCILLSKSLYFLLYSVLPID